MSSNLPLFWNLWVAGLVVISLFFLTLFIIRIYFPKKQHKEKTAVWDETLIEGTSPPPLWWFWLIIGALFFTVIYMIFYPSLGNYNGLFNLGSEHRYLQSRENIDNRYHKKLENLANSDYQELRKNPHAMRLAENIFAQNCAGCHGMGATGQHHFPDLKDDEWLWGKSAAQIRHGIENGRNAVMPGWQAALGDDGVLAVARYVQALGGKTQAADNDFGREKFQQFCASCHGKDGGGNALLGAPNLKNDIWLYGGDLDALKKSIAKGRNGVMPAQKNRLSDLQIRLLTAWLLPEKSTEKSKNPR